MTDINKAFDAAVKEGYTGSRAEFILSLKSKQSFWFTVAQNVITAMLIVLLGNLAVDNYNAYRVTKEMGLASYYILSVVSVLLVLVSLRRIFKPVDTE